MDPLSLQPVTLRATPEVGHPQGKTAEVAEHFEAILLTQLLKGLRRTVPVADESDAARDLYHELFDETIAAHVARAGGIGLASMLRESIDRVTPAAGGAAGSQGQGSPATPAAAIDTPAGVAPKAPAGAAEPGGGQAEPTSPEVR